MKPHLVKREGVRPEDLIGRVLCHDLARVGPASAAGLRKGHRVQENEIALLLRQEWDELHLLELGEEDLSEEEAGTRLSGAVAGPGVTVKKRPHGKVELIAAHKGLLKVEAAALRRLNGLEGMAVYTLFTNQVVSVGETVANAQITPLAVVRSTVKEAVQIARRAGGLVRVLPFSRWRVGAILTGRVNERDEARFRVTLGEKLRWFGCDDLLDVVHLSDDPDQMRKTVQAFHGSGTHLLLIGGGNAMDPLDPVFRGLAAAGVRMERHGMPSHPGTLLWIASLGGMTIIGLPACGMFSHATLFDLLLPRYLAEGTISLDELADFGHGGLLNRTMAFRFPPYQVRQPVGPEEGRP
jgi:hypothetical protein